MVIVGPHVNHKYILLVSKLYTNMFIRKSVKRKTAAQFIKPRKFKMAAKALFSIAHENGLHL